MASDQVRGQSVDPSYNVEAVIEAANRRQDDLRIETNRRLDAEISHLKAMACIRETCGKEIADLREKHAKEISVAETNRLNAIRQFDVGAVSTAADRAQAAINTLAVATSSNAENIRNALTTTAAAIAAQTASTVAAITERIAALEKSSYEGKGKQLMADPQMSELVAEMKRMRETAGKIEGKGEGIGLSWVILLGVVSLLSMLWALFRP